MKITAEFNSNEELLSFINTFGTSAVHQTINLSPSVIEKDTKSAPKAEKTIKEEPKVDKKEEKKAKVTEEVKQDEKVENKEEGAAEEVEDKQEEKVTLEMVRAVFAKIIKAGKQKEAKELTTKYGASKLPELKEEDYSKILKEAEELI